MPPCGAGSSPGRQPTRLLEDHLPEGLEAVPRIEVTTRASFPPSVRDPDASAPDRFLAYRPDGATRRRVGVLTGNRVGVHEPTELEFPLDQLTGR